MKRSKESIFASIFWSFYLYQSIYLAVSYLQSERKGFNGPIFAPAVELFQFNLKFFYPAPIHSCKPALISASRQMAFESPPASQRRVSTQSKEKSTERVEHTEDAEKSKKKYKSRTHILENKMQEWEELLNNDLWDSFHTEFAEWIDENSKLTSITIRKNFKAFLRSRDVWVMKSSKLIIAKSLAQVVKRDISISWTEEEIRSCLNSETFVSHVIIHVLKTNFERNSKDYSWQASQSESKHSEPSRSTKSRIQSTEPHLRSTQKSPPRERSVQQKPVTREMKMQQSSIRSLHQPSIRHPPRELSIARNFLRQPPSSPPQPPEIFYRENPYSDPLPRSENPYIRQPLSPEKESMLKQSFQPRFPKFYQSSELPEQFYRRSTEYSPLIPPRSLVAPRTLPHKYSPPIPPRPFASSPSRSSVNQLIKTSEYDRELINLTKLYSDKTKYNKENDNFSFKLIMFNDMCDRVDVSSETKLKAFLTMLKRLALNYYYSNVINSKASFTFDDVCVSIMSYFEDAEYKRSILNK